MSFARGVDVSDVQSVAIDWAALLAEGYSFTYHRCGNGNDPPDPNFPSRIDGAMRAGLLGGAYAPGFPLPPDPAHPGREPYAQARAHYQQCGGLGSGGGELPPMLDLEWPVPGSPEWTKYAAIGMTKATVRDWAYAYLQEAESLWGVLPVLYDGFPDFWAACGIDGASDSRFAKYPLWVVDYPAPYQHVAPPDDSLLVVPEPWGGKNWKLWQHAGGTMRLPGGVPIDGDVFNGDVAALRAFARGRSSIPLAQV